MPISQPTRRLLICLLAIGPQAIWTPAAAGDPSERVFVGYVSGEPGDIDYSLYTHLCHAFVVADADGTLRDNPAVPSKTLAERAHRHGVRVLISLGGWGWDAQFAAMVLDPAAEARYVESVLRLVDEHDYDGIDLDWEYPDSREEIPGFERLTRRLRAGLDALEKKKGRPMLLTMASSSHPNTLDWLSNEFLLETMDWINVMTYDYAGSWTGYAGHNAPLNASSRAPAGEQRGVAKSFEYLLEKRGLPADRLALGLPLYGRAFSVTTPYAKTVGTEKPGRAFTYNQARGLIDQGWVRSWDDESGVPWLHSPDGSSLLGYDDQESIRLKVRWANERGLRGVFFWEVSQDRDPRGGHELQQAAKEAMRPSE